MTMACIFDIAIREPPRSNHLIAVDLFQHLSVKRKDSQQGCDWLIPPFLRAKLSIYFQTLPYSAEPQGSKGDVMMEAKKRSLLVRRLDMLVAMRTLEASRKSCTSNRVNHVYHK